MIRKQKVLTRYPNLFERTQEFLEISEKSVNVGIKLCPWTLWCSTNLLPVDKIEFKRNQQMYWPVRVDPFVIVVISQL